MRSIRAVAFCMVLLAVSACQPGNEEAENASANAMEKSSVDAASDEAAMAELRDSWVAAANRDDAAAVAAMYASDAVYLGADGLVLEGPQAIQTAFTESFKASSDLSVSEGSGELVGDVNYRSGTYKQKVTANGKTSDVEGTYLVVSKRQADGSWKIVRHASSLKPAK